MYLRDSTRLLDEIPYRRSYGVQTVICAAAKVEDHRLCVQYTGDLVLYGLYGLVFGVLGGDAAHLCDTISQ